LGTREIARAILSSGPLETILSRIADLPAGLRVLNRLDPSGGLYSNFEEGWAAARKLKRVGHEHPDAIKTHLDLSKDLRSSDYAALFWISRIASSELRVFDFGGNAGNLYYSYSRFLNGELRKLQWIVFDLPAIRQEGRRLAEERNASDLRFAESAAEARSSDILLVSGAFHYWEKSIAEFLRQFPTPPAHVILNRTPLHGSRPAFVTVQETSSYAVPCVVRNAGQLVEEFAAVGYRLMDRWPALELSLRMPLFPRYSVPHYSGLYFRRDTLTRD
jgi:putative methyltransferase (TIGR04325 family)